MFELESEGIHLTGQSLNALLVNTLLKLPIFLEDNVFELENESIHVMGQSIEALLVDTLLLNF